MYKRIFLFICVVLITTPLALSQTSEPLDVAGILRSLDNQQQEILTDGSAIQDLPDAWWIDVVGKPILSRADAKKIDIEKLLILAVHTSAEIAVNRYEPFIRRTDVKNADANFDWNYYFDTLWRDISEPTGSVLAAGGLNRLNEHDLSATGGFRKNNRQGSTIEISQQMGHQNNNSRFFDPNDQGNARLTLSFTQPLLRGRGEQFNTGLNVLARIDVDVAEAQFLETLQDQLLRISEAYWNLYLQRAILAQKVKLYSTTVEIEQRIQARLNLDASKPSAASAKSAVTSRRSDLILARASVANAESQLKALVNARILDEAVDVELIPTEPEIVIESPVELKTELETAVVNRGNIQAALKNLTAAGVRHDLAKQELLPVLNMVTDFYLMGLEGESELGKAWINQFKQGAPSYSVGFNYEWQIGNRAASARLERQQLELAQLTHQYRRELAAVRAEVEIAARNLAASRASIFARYEAVQTAQLEVDSLTARWSLDLQRNQSNSLALITLLQSQERLNQAEEAYMVSIIQYKLDVLRLRKANGTLFQMQTASIKNHQIVNEQLMEAVPTESGSIVEVTPGDSVIQAMPSGPQDSVENGDEQIIDYESEPEATHRNYFEKMFHRLPGRPPDLSRIPRAATLDPAEKFIKRPRLNRVREVGESIKSIFR
ncbi:MAG: TolC family protein [Planctomycetota bacterium]